jgi:hypothetical protein
MIQLYQVCHHVTEKLKIQQNGVIHCLHEITLIDMKELANMGVGLMCIPITIMMGLSLGSTLEAFEGPAPIPMVDSYSHLVNPLTCFIG